MTGSKEKQFRKRMLSLMLCAAVVWQSFSPSALRLVYAAEASEVNAGASGVEQPVTAEGTAGQSLLPETEAAEVTVEEPAAEAASQETAAEGSPEEEAAYEETAGDSDLFYVDPNEVAPESQDAENYFTPEEIAGAEAFYQMEEEEEPVYSEEEIRAEEEEKARRDAEEQKTKVDDSYKFEDEPEEDEEGKEGEEAAGKTVERDCKARIGDDYYNSIKPSEMIKKAASSKKPITLYDGLEVVKTLSIPKKKSVTIYLNGYNISGIKGELGSNAVFKVEEGATLKLIGNDNNSYTKNRLVNGGNGFVIAKKKSNLYLKNVKLMNNHTYTNGGGIYLGEKVNCELYNARIDENSAENCGGGIYVAGAQTNISLDQYTSIDRNKAKFGGGIYINKSKVNIYAPATGKTQVQGNDAKSGGGLYLNSTDIAVAGLKIDGNTASESNGGGVRMEKTKTSLTNCLITNNYSRNNGGGVYINGKVATLTDCEVTLNECEAGYNGGGIYVDSQDNIKTGGRFIVTKNYNGKDVRAWEHMDNERYWDDLYLQNGKASNAYIHAAEYAPGSKIGIGVTDWKEGQRITFEPGNFNPKVFYCNFGVAEQKKKPGTYYITLNNNTKSKNYRHLVITKSSQQANKASGSEGISFGDKNKTRDTGIKYSTSDGKNYELKYGYNSSPSHTDEKVDIVNKYFYSDGYFFDDPAVYNPHLATFGMNLAMASADSNIGSHDDYTFKFDNVRSMLRGMGCEEKDIYISPSYIVRPTSDSIGVAIGSKTIKNANDGKEYTLVPIAIRSYGYEKEWASNMTIDGKNTSGENNAEHSGFRDARTKVMNAIKSYISTYGLEGQLNQGRVKFFLVGFSRGSATANLTSKALVDTYGVLSDKYKNNPNQVFGYCYAVPSGATDNCDLSLTKNRKAYYCIHNIINQVDLTPMVAPKEMGFKRYGVDHYVPGDDAGAVKSYVSYAARDNGSYKRTTFYDNNAWWTNSSSYAVKKPSMLKQLAMVNDQIHFVDWFKETDMITGKAEGVKSFVKGLVTEASPVKFEQVKKSTATLESWLPEFYKTVQEYKSVGENENLTRKAYSSTVVRAGKEKDLKKDERNWYVKGVTAQDTFRGLVQMMLSKTPSEKATLGAAFGGLGNKLSLKQITLLYERLINSKKGWDYSKARQQNYLDMFWNMLKDNSYGQKAIQDAITDPRELAELENYFPSLMSIAFRIIRQDFNDKKHSGKMRLVGTFASNTEAILQGHVPEIALAWLRAYDDYYANEDKSYYWKTNTYSKGSVTFKVSGNAVQSEYEGSQVMKLSSSNPDDAIYYTMTEDNKESIPMLYNERQGIVLNAPGDNTTRTYKIKAWTKYSYAGSDRKIIWQKGDDETKEVKVKAKTVTPEVQTYKVKLTKTYYVQDWGYKNGDEIELDTGIPTRYGQKFDILSVKNFMDELYPNYLIMYRYLTMVPNQDFEIKLYPRIKEVRFKPELIEKVKPETSKKLVTKFNKIDKVEVKFTKSAPDQPDKYYAYNAYAVADALKWEEKTGENSYTPVKNGTAKPNTEYRAVLNLVKSYRDFDKHFTDKLKISYGDGSSQTIRPYDDRDNNDAVLRFDKTERISITDCKAENAESWTWEEESEKETVKGGAEDLPVYAGTISAGGKTVSGLEVEWNPDRYTKKDENTYTVKGQIKYDEGTKAAVFASDDYKWDRPRFEVEGTIHVVERKKLLPAYVSLPGGSYTFIYDNIPLNDQGKMTVRLSNTNGVSGCSINYKKWESGVDEPPYSVSNDDITLEFDTPDEGKTKTWKIKVMITTTKADYTQSDEKTYTYTLSYPVIRTVNAFTWDINDKPVSLSGADIRFSEEAEKGDEVMVDYDDMVDDDELYYYELVSWNVISGNAPGKITEVPGYHRTLWHEVTDDNVHLMAQIAPVLTDMDVTVERPSTGEGLQALPEELRLEIGGEEYDIDPGTVSMNWTASENSADDGIAKSQTTYTAAISINTVNLKYSDPWSESGNYLDLDLKFLEGEELDCAVNGVNKRSLSGNSAGIQDIYYTFTEDETKGYIETINIYVTFKKSGAATFLMVEPPEGLSLSFNAATKDDRYNKDIWPNLPKTAEVLVDDGSIRSLSVDWADDLESYIYDEEGNLIEHVTKGIAYEQFGYAVTADALNTLDAWSLSMNGYVTLPDGVDYLKDENGEPLNEDIVSENGVVRCYFEYPVDMAGAPESNMPDILPGSGEYDPSTEDLVVEFNTVPLAASTNKVTVYYKITGGRYEEEESEDYDFDLEAPVWYDENGELVSDNEAHIYIPYDGATTDKASLDDLKYRTITRAWADEYDYDYAKVTAIALQDGAYRISAMSEAVYEFLPKPVAEITEETLEALDNLELTSGTSLQTLKLPENCRWSPETDIYEKHTERAGNYIYATVIYNDDPDNFNDLILNTGILITAGTYNVTAEGCRVYVMDEEADEDDETFDPEWPEVTKAQAERRLYISANAPEGEFDLLDWIVTDSEGNEVDYTYAGEDDDDQESVRDDVIILEMPYSDIRVKPVWYDRLHPLAPVKSLTVAPSYVELKKGGTATITANAVYDESDEEMAKPEISFVSSDPSVVKVSYSQGTAKVTAVSSGSATIWVDCADKAAACLVSVGVVNVDLQLTDCRAYDTTGGAEKLLTDSAVKGSTIRLEANAPKNPAMVFKEWTVSGADIDVRKNPVIFKVQTDIVARPEYDTDPAYEDPGEYAYKNVKIRSLTITDPASKKKITRLTASLNGLTTVDAKAVYKNTADMPPIVFKSSNTDVAKVKTVSGQNPGQAQCVIAGFRAGVATITAYCGNKTAKLKVTVGDEEVKTIKLFSERLQNTTEKIDGQYTLELHTGEQELISAYPDDDYNTTPMKVTWKSDDPKVATVRNGLVTAKIADKGHTTVTAQAKVKPYGSNKWIKLEPVKIVVRVREIEIPKKVRNDKSYRLSLKASQNLDLTAAKIGKKNVISGCTVTAKLKGTKPAALEWKSTNESIVSVNAKEGDDLSARILAKGIGTAYVVLEGTNPGSNLTNRAVMKITVKATAPDIEFTNDTLNAFSEDYTTLTLKRGIYDRLAVNISCPVPGEKEAAVTSNVSEKITWSGSGGVTVTDGVVFAKNISKKGKNAKITLKCGKSKKVLNVIVVE